MKFNSVLFLLVFAVCAPVLSAEEKATPAEKTNRLIVKYASPVDPAKSPADPVLAKLAGGPVLSARVMSSGASVVDLGRHRPVREMHKLAETMSRQPGVLYAEPDLIMVHQAVPDDSRYYEQWHYYEPEGGINLSAAWDLITSPQEVVVAVVDTGVRHHVDLKENLVPGYDFIADVDVAQDGSLRDRSAKDPGDFAPQGACGTDSYGRQMPLVEEPSSWHGTHVAGTIAAVNNNSRGISGIGVSTRILPVRVLGRCGGYTSDITDGMRWAAGLQVAGVPQNSTPAKVLNLSLGGSGRCSRTYQDAIDDIVAAGVTVVVAAGNEGQNASWSSPANCDNVITVAANRRDGGRAYYSNFGTAVDVTAPGGETSVPTDGILSTIDSGCRTPEGDDYGWYQGTSMAAPHVAGIVSLMYAVKPDLKPADVKHILQDTARDFPQVSRRRCTRKLCGAGIVDAAAAVKAVLVTDAEASPACDVILKNGVAVAGLSIPEELSQSKQLFYRFEVPPGVRNLSFSISGNNGDADLYVRRGLRPSVEKYDCAPFQQSSNEECEFSAPRAGTWYVMLDGYTGFSGVSLVAEYDQDVFLETTGETTFSSSTAYPIPDNRVRGVTVPVHSSYSGASSRVSVDVDISHPYIGDLQITLTSPDGNRQVLKKTNSAQNIADLKETYEIPAVDGPAYGEWKLTVSDNNRKDAGTLNSWSITFHD